jgi:hypothetical protein
MSKTVLEILVARIHDTLYFNPATSELDPDLVWDTETIEAVAGILDGFGIGPPLIRG